MLLALGGDILDLLQVATPRTGWPRSWTARRRADRRGPAAPGRTARASVLYLVGNHDSTLAWDAAARKLVADRFGVTDSPSTPGSGSSARRGGEVVVVAEHGDALDRWNRRTDPFDPLDVPIGDHVVLEFVNCLEAASGRYPQLALNEVDNVQPGLLVPWWLVSNFFYKFMGRALRDFALPLVLLTIALNLAVGLLVGDLGRIAYLGNRAVRWVSSFVLTDLALLALLSTFLPELRRAAAAYGLPTPDEAEDEAQARKGDLPELLARRDPGAAVLVTGHTHEPGIIRLPGEKVAADAGCWVRGLVPVRAWLSLPPVFVPTYPVNWVDVQATSRAWPWTCGSAAWPSPAASAGSSAWSPAALSRPPTPPVPRWRQGRHVSVTFDRAAGFYDESRGLRPEVSELVADRVEEAVEPAARLLEIGVGTGRIALPRTAVAARSSGSTCRCRCWTASGQGGRRRAAAADRAAGRRRAAVPRRLRRRRARGPRAAPGPRLGTGAGRGAAGARRDAAARRGGATSGAAAAHATRSCGASTSWPSPATGRREWSAPPPTGRCWTPWSPWAGGSRSWSRSSGRSRRPTPRRCAGSRSGSSPPTGACPTRLAERRRPGAGRDQAAHPDLDTPTRAGTPSSSLAIRF